MEKGQEMDRHTGRVIALTIVGLVVAASLVGGGWWLAQRGDDSPAASGVPTAPSVVPSPTTGAGQSSSEGTGSEEPSSPTAGGATGSKPVVLADGRHAAFLTTVNASRRTITFDVIQLYFGDEAVREAIKDGHRQYPAPNGVYIRNVNPRLRTLAVRADATITVVTLAWEGSNYSDDNVPVSLDKLATLKARAGDVPFWLTVRHDQVLKIAEQFVP
jgi:hypothetical protein